MVSIIASVVVKATKTSKKRKSSDDGPKKLSPYILFSQANRDVVKKKNPEASFGDVAKLLGKRGGVFELFID